MKEAIQIANLNYYGLDMPNRIYSPDGISPTLKTVSGGGGEVKKLDKHDRYRKLTEWEYFRLMGFDDSDYQVLAANGISKTQIYKMAGNSIAVPVLEHLFKQLFQKDRVSILKQNTLSLLDSL